MTSRSLVLLLLAVLPLACSRAPTPPITTAAPAPTPKPGEPGAPQNAIMTDAEIRAMQRARAVESQVLQQQNDALKRADSDTDPGKN